MSPLTPSDQFAICYANHPCVIHPVTEDSIQNACWYIKNITQMVIPVTIDLSPNILNTICNTQCSLQRLTCFSTQLDDTAIKSLEKLKKLEVLLVSGKMTENVTDTLQKLPQLRFVIMSSPHFEKDADKRINKSLPNAYVGII